jgi:predicted nucleic acid-binding protein
MMKRCLLDANVLLRFMRNDDPVQSPQARDLLRQAERGEVRLVASILTFAEVFYALRASYRVARPVAAEALSQLLGTGLMEIDQERLLGAALRRVASHNVDLGDAVLAAETATTGDEVASFDQDFRRFTDVRRHDWTS